MQRLLDEVKNDKKLSKSVFVKPIMQYIKGEVDFGTDEAFVKGLDDEEKSIKQLGEYLFKQAKIEAGKERMIAVPDDIVFSWVKNYFVSSNKSLFPEEYERMEKERFYKSFDKENLTKNSLDQLKKHAEYEGKKVPENADVLDLVNLLAPAKKKRKTKKKTEPKPKEESKPKDPVAKMKQATKDALPKKSEPKKEVIDVEQQSLFDF